MTTSNERNKVPGDNNATYGPIPESDQLFKIELLEIAPTPIPVDVIFFTLLRGYVDTAKAQAKGIDDAALANASISVTMSVTSPEGETDEPNTYTAPLRPIANMMGHLAIRNSLGVYVESLTLGKRDYRTHDIITDLWIPGMFLETGMWRFEVVAKLEDESCLFALTVEQWLEGKKERISPQTRAVASPRSMSTPAEGDGIAEGECIPGNNNARLGPIPEKDQAFKIELLEMSPLPIPVDTIFFALLRGHIPQIRAKDLGINEAALEYASMTINLELISPENIPNACVYYILPLRIQVGQPALFIIRNGRGELAETLTVGEPHECTNEILTNMWLPSPFVETGTWRIEVVAKVPDGTCLFAFTIIQWLEGNKNWKDRVPSENPFADRLMLAGGASIEKGKEKMQ